MSGSERVGGWLRPVGAGLVLGAAWGALARVYMRLVSTNPEFSWSGTLAILGVAAVFGGTLGLVHAARLRGGRAWWRLAVLPGLLLFAGPGALLFPAALLGGFAWGTRAWWPVRLLAAAAVLVLPLVLWETTPAVDRIGISLTVSVVGLWVLSVPLAAAGATWFRRWPARVTQPVALEPAIA
jgi:hypothetical protein